MVEGGASAPSLMFAGQTLSVTLGFAERIRRLFQAKGEPGGGVMSSSCLHPSLHGDRSVSVSVVPLSVCSVPGRPPRGMPVSHVVVEIMRRCFLAGHCQAMTARCWWPGCAE